MHSSQPVLFYESPEEDKQRCGKKGAGRAQVAKKGKTERIEPENCPQCDRKGTYDGARCSSCGFYISGELEKA